MKDARVAATSPRGTSMTRRCVTSRLFWSVLSFVIFAGATLSLAATTPVDRIQRSGGRVQVGTDGGVTITNPSATVTRFTRSVVFDGIAAPSVAPAGKGKFYFDAATNQFLFSSNTGAYAPLGGSPAGVVIERLGSATVDLNGDSTKQIIYTVPAGKKAVVVDIAIRNVTAADSFLNAELRIGWNANADDVSVPLNSGRIFIPVNTNGRQLLSTYVSAQGGSLIKTVVPVGNAGESIGVVVNEPEGLALTCVVDVFGYVY